MLVKEVHLETVCGSAGRLPKGTLPEIAFLGKSNVGKSSLINRLVNRKAYARTSAVPGKTQTINYYRINRNAYFVDLPGYGYARVSKEMRAAWQRLIRRYLDTAPNLLQVCLLVDMRRDAAEKDLAVIRAVRQRGVPLLVIATKQDKIKRSQRKSRLLAIRSGLGLTEAEPLFAVSSLTGDGKAAIEDFLEQRLAGCESH